jgi:ABC-type dipeptide/oligopeptide/nickel transport system ATPase component
MDEPFGALDAQTRSGMQELLLHIWDETASTVLFVTHDVDEAIYLADRVYIMSARPGTIMEDVPVPLAAARPSRSSERVSRAAAARPRVSAARARTRPGTSEHLMPENPQRPSAAEICSGRCGDQPESGCGRGGPGITTTREALWQYN